MRDIEALDKNIVHVNILRVDNFCPQPLRYLLALNSISSNISHLPLRNVILTRNLNKSQRRFLL